MPILDDGWWGRVGEIILEGNKERIWRHELEGGERGMSGHVGKSNVAGNTDGPRIET